MVSENLGFNFVLVYFIYGLAFFSMGLAMMMEAWRSPLLAEARVLWPLAIFGLVHGFHEWLEIALIVRNWFGFNNPTFTPILRLALLVFSFASLALYGMQVLHPNGRPLGLSNISIILGLLGFYSILVLITTFSQPDPAAHWVDHADALARYILAVPAAGAAALALFRQAGQTQLAKIRARSDLSRSLRLGGLGFAVYSLTQLLVTPANFYPANVLNSVAFLVWAGFPIQAVRACMAVLVTVGLMRATQVVDEDRTRQLVAAQEARLQALEQIQRDLAERETLRRELLRHTVLAQEEERGRIARELHDETAQFLTALRLDLATLQSSLRRNPEAGRILERVQSLNQQMARGIYRMVHHLRPAQLDDLGLVAALGYLADEARHSGLEVTLRVEGSRQRLEPLVETVLFRIAQEALTNVARHANCDRAEAVLSFETQQVALRVYDEGVGFDPGESRVPPRGWGLEGMRERAESVGARFSIDSVPGGGTHVEVVVPFVHKGQKESEEGSYEYDPVNAG